MQGFRVKHLLTPTVMNALVDMCRAKFTNYQYKLQSNYGKINTKAIKKMSILTTTVSQVKVEQHHFRIKHVFYNEIFIRHVLVPM